MKNDICLHFNPYVYVYIYLERAQKELISHTFCYYRWFYPIALAKIKNKIRHFIIFGLSGPIRPKIPPKMVTIKNQKLT